MSPAPAVGVRQSTAHVRSQIVAVLRQNGSLSAADLCEELRLPYTVVNRGLNAEPGVGEPPIARTRNTAPGATWVYYLVTGDHPLTHQDFVDKTRTALTQMTKAQENLVDPAVRAGAIASGDDQDIETARDYLRQAIDALRRGHEAGARQAERIARERAAARAESEADVAERDQRIAELEAQLAALRGNQ